MELAPSVSCHRVGAARGSFVALETTSEPLPILSKRSHAPAGIHYGQSRGGPREGIRQGGWITAGVRLGWLRMISSWSVHSSYPNLVTVVLANLAAGLPLSGGRKNTREMNG